MKLPVNIVIDNYCVSPSYIKTSEKDIEFDDIDISIDFKSIGSEILKEKSNILYIKEIFSTFTQSFESILIENYWKENLKLVEKLKPMLNNLILENYIYDFKLNPEEINITILSGESRFYFYNIDITNLSFDSVDEQIQNLKRYCILTKCLN